MTETRKPGRPRMEPEKGARKRRSIYLTDDRLAYARKLGKGSASEGIAVALDNHRKRDDD